MSFSVKYVDQLLVHYMGYFVVFKEEENNGDNEQRKTVDVRRPPMTTTAMLERVSEPAERERAVGSMPTTMVRVVMKIGRKRTRPASIMACRGGRPRSMRVRV